MSKPENSDRDKKHVRETIATLPADMMEFLVGVGTLGFGTVALVRWAYESWQEGARLPVAGVAALVILSPIAFLYFFRRRRVVAVVVAILWLGGVALVLARHGVSLPTSWFS